MKHKICFKYFLWDKAFAIQGQRNMNKTVINQKQTKQELFPRQTSALNQI